ncbi:MAG TPA: helix-turn-helix domain-containing protein [Candidatus Elarobacter sp.]|jgi:hypothetical protein|nr:helix-turn-helix domain-containing protein [Candidatus Elarobacter sp.]
MNGTSKVAFDRYVFDVLMRDLVGHDGRASAYLVYLHLGSRAARGVVRASYTDVASATGLSKRGVQEAVAWLARRQLIDVTREGPTSVPLYAVRQPWRRSA